MMAHSRKLQAAAANFRPLSSTHDDTHYDIIWHAMMHGDITTPRLRLDQFVHNLFDCDRCATAAPLAPSHCCSPHTVRRLRSVVAVQNTPTTHDNTTTTNAISRRATERHTIARAEIGRGRSAVTVQWSRHPNAYAMRHLYQARA